MAISKYMLYTHVKVDGTWRYCKAAYHDNAKIKPDIIFVNVKQGLLEKHPEGRYYMSHNGGWIDAGTDALEAQRKRKQRLALDEYPSHRLTLLNLSKHALNGTIRTLAVYIDMTFQRRVVMLSRSRRFGRCPEARWANCAFGTIQASIALLVLLLLVHPSQAFAANPDLETVLTGSRQRIEKLDYRLTGRLTRVEGNGKRTSYKFVAKAHWFPDGLRLLCEISGPGSEKTSLLLHMSVSGHVTIDAVLPGEKAASVLPFEHWNDPLVGTDFSYEDMVESQFFWKDQELLATEKYGARDCFVLKSKSGSQDRTYYDSVTSWIDRGILFPVHVVKTLRGTGQQKEFIYYGLRQAGGAWSATQVEAKMQGKPSSSILVIEGGSPKAHLGRKDFDISRFSVQGEKVK